MATPTSPGFVSFIFTSGLNNIDGLLFSEKWGGSTGTGVNLTYSFGQYNTSYYITTYGSDEPWNGFQPLTATQQSAAKKALAAWSDVANVNFIQVTDSSTVAGDIRFATSDQAAPTAYAYLPGAYTEAGDIWFSNSSSYNTDTKGTYGYITFLHEIGHALGLKHTHEANGSGVVTNASQDYTLYSVMSYRSYENAPLGSYGQSFYPTTPMINDIAAIQHIYGADYSTRSGNTTYSWGTGQQILETIWDGGGIDTIDWSNQSSSATIILQDGRFSKLGPSYWDGVKYESRTLGIAYKAIIENAKGGSAGDLLTGNASANTLTGNGGNDALSGLSNNDSLYGGSGNDTLDGGSGRDYLTGEIGNDILRGSTEDDILIGAGGFDTLTGGMGKDRFIFNSKNEGRDTITDFSVVDDIFHVSKAGFGGGLTATAVITTAQFRLGSAAADASDRFIYNKSTGGLFFDIDGKDGTGQVQFAQISTNLALTNNDFFVIA